MPGFVGDKVSQTNFVRQTAPRAAAAQAVAGEVPGLSRWRWEWVRLELSPGQQEGALARAGAAAAAAALSREPLLPGQEPAVP